MINRLDEHRDQRGWDILEAAAGDLAYNVGSNVGQAARVLARNFAVVVALEPCAESFEILDSEMPANVVCLQVAAGDHDGELTLDEAERSIQTGQLVTGPGLPMWGDRVGTRTVPCRTLDSLTRSFGQPDFCLIDCEGSEVDVLRGAQEMIAAHHPYMHVEVHRAEHGPLVRSLLPGYDLTELRHGDYVKPGGEIWSNHYWLSGRVDA